MDIFTARSRPIKLAAVILRRKAECEEIIYGRESIPYSPGDYEVLLRHWPSETYFNYLAVFSGPVTSSNPEETLLTNCFDWSAGLAAESGHHGGIKGLKAVFLSLTGTSNSLTDDDRDSTAFLTYIIPTTHKGSSIVSSYSNTTQFPQFYSLQTILQGMYSNTVNVHPSTKEILALLDNWLRNKHTLPYAIEQLFRPPATVVHVINNPIHQNGTSNMYEEFKRMSEKEKVDRYIENPFFGSGIKFKDTPDMYVVNKYFGMGVPNYETIGMKYQESALESGTEWIEQFPLHKFACEGDAEGIKQCIHNGYDPDQLDTDGWTSLHYACWYGELDSVMCLLKEGDANVNKQNESGSTPLHFAAGNGHRAIVEHLLQTHRINTELVDNQGRTPLDVCTENKSNEWKETEQILKSNIPHEEHVDATTVRVVRLPSIQIDEDEDEENEIVAYEDEDNENEVVKYEDEGTENEVVKLSLLSKYEVDLTLRGSLIDIIDDDDKEEELPLPPRILSTTRKVDISFMDGQHLLANFYQGEETLSAEVLKEACSIIHLSLDFQYVVALWIQSESFYLQLGDADKPLKLFSKWPTLLKRFTKGNPLETPHIFLKRNVFLSSFKESSVSDPVAIQYLYYDALHCVLNGMYPSSEEEALELATITMQVKFGDYNVAVHTDKFVSDKLSLVAPLYNLRGKKRFLFEKRLLKKYKQQSQTEHGSLVLYNRYLDKCRKWPYYGAMFFEGTVTVKVHKQTESTSHIKQLRKVLMRVGINTLGFHFINKDTNNLVHSHALDNVRWNMVEQKQTFNLKTLDSSISIAIQSKQCAILNSLATQMKKELDLIKRSFLRTQHN